MRRWWVGATLILVVSLLVVWLRPWSRQQMFVTISKETTFFTQPLTSDGYVSYATAIDQLNAVPRHENAAADLIVLQGVPEYWEDGQREKLRQLLDVPETLPVAGTHLKSQYYLQRDAEAQGKAVPSQDERMEQDTIVLSRPWTRKDAPFFDDLLEANSPCLDQVDAILNRSGYFEPMVKGRAKNLTTVPESCKIAQSARWALRDLLISRAYRHLGHGKHQEAVDDLLRVHRLARLGERAKVVAGLWDNINPELRALEAGVEMIHAADFPIEVLESYLKSLMELSSIAEVQTGFLFRRLSYLSMVCECARESPVKFLQSISSAQDLVDTFAPVPEEHQIAAGEKSELPYVYQARSKHVDWNHLLRGINRDFDKMATFYEIRSPLERIQVFRQYTHEMQSTKRHFADQASYETATAEDADEARRHLADDLRAELDKAFSVELHATHEEFAFKARMDLLRLLVASKIYEKRHQQLPDSSAALAGILSPEPIDPFSEKPYRSKRTEEGLEWSSASNDDASLPKAFRELKVIVRPTAGSGR